jgi:hypothetical protein
MPDQFRFLGLEREIENGCYRKDCFAWSPGQRRSAKRCCRLRRRVDRLVTAVHLVRSSEAGVDRCTRGNELDMSAVLPAKGSRRPHLRNATGGCASESPRATPCRHPSWKQNTAAGIASTGRRSDHRRRPARPRPVSLIQRTAAGSRPAELTANSCVAPSGAASLFRLGGCVRGHRFTVAPQHPGGRCP